MQTPALGVGQPGEASELSRGEGWAPLEGRRWETARLRSGTSDLCLLSAEALLDISECHRGPHTPQRLGLTDSLPEKQELDSWRDCLTPK